jgi:hypothetical protein
LEPIPFIAIPLAPIDFFAIPKPVPPEDCAEIIVPSAGDPPVAPIDADFAGVIETLLRPLSRMVSESDWIKDI